MSNPASLVAACALALTLSAGVARADGTSAFSASDTALLMGNTASPGRLYVPTPSDEDRNVTGSIPAAAPAPHGHKAPARTPVR
ncbi:MULTISPECIES: hypothetical protein [unclassified Methylobacterium]|jgi:hypothetical protein|uniref:hypothetical protein n=1 Tax=unclassified Methylobacterium TaxID=2615210 RepID=UPI00135283F7|nr:hypothetical protein [Methylobacterium sp. 2A]MWV24566.1 hypothetical protein [Methylobacterium sp. 2A]